VSKRRGNFYHNYPLVIKYLTDNKIAYAEYANGQHLKILGDTTIIDLWPSRMTYHIIRSEEPHRPNEYSRLSFSFDELELDRILKGSLYNTIS
jgi:hypothetical protein